MLRGTLQDITQRKIVEDALRKSESLLEQTQEITRVGGWEYDAATKKSNGQKKSIEFMKLILITIQVMLLKI